MEILHFTFGEPSSPYSAAALHALWCDAFVDDLVWHTSLSAFSAKLAGKQIVCAQRGDALQGFAAYEENATTAALAVIAVHPSCRRQGIAQRLLNDVLERLQVKQLRAAAGCGSYFWPGVPLNLPAATAFFERSGFVSSEVSHDLILPLAGVELSSPSLPSGISLALASSRPLAVDAFEQLYFPEWAGYFRTAQTEGRSDDILFAHNANDEILGTVLLFGPEVHLWSKALGTKVGGFGALGVSEAAREQGIGLALAIEASRLLQQRGAEISFVGWTWLVDWYGRIGYQPFQSYTMCARDWGL